MPGEMIFEDGTLNMAPAPCSSLCLRREGRLAMIDSRQQHHRLEAEHPHGHYLKRNVLTTCS